MEKGKEPKQHSGSGTKAAQESERGTPEVPFVVDTQGHIQTKAEAADAKAEKDHAAYIEGRTLCFTGISAIATVALVLVGLGGVFAAMWTLLAIKSQTNHMVNSERAWVIISATHPPALVPLSPGMIRPWNVFRFDLVNKGKTVATIMEFNGGCRVLPIDAALPSVPEYTRPPLQMHGYVLAPDITINGVSVEIDEPLDARKLNLILRSELRLYVYGFIDYLDFSMKPHTIKFCYIFIPGVRRTDTVDPPDHWDLYPPPYSPISYNDHT
jgi:hypothetical protein